MVEKITQPLTPLQNTEKINEIIDNFADKNLSNLSATGQQILDNKVDYDAAVLKSGDTMTGPLTVNNLTGGGAFYAKSGTVDMTKTPTSAEFNQIIFLDKHGTRYGFLEALHATNGCIEMKLTLTRDGSNYHALFVGIDANNNPYTYAPTPANNSNGGNIATTKFVKSVLSSSSAGLATISKAQKGYCKFTNGLIIQWGIADKKGTFTFPTAFSSKTSYGLSMVGVQGNDFVARVTARTATNFTYTPMYLDDVDATWVAIGY